MEERLFYPGNAYDHTSEVSLVKIQEILLELVNHSSSLPNLITCDFFLSTKSIVLLGGERFLSNVIANLYEYFGKHVLKYYLKS